MTDPARIACDVCVVGSGMAGMSAALFAANRGLATVLVGRTGEIIFSTGLLDLLGVHPIGEGKIWSDPWAGMAALVKDLPRHPYARLAAGEIRAALDEVLRFFEANGLAYAGLPKGRRFGARRSRSALPVPGPTADPRVRPSAASPRSRSR